MELIVLVGGQAAGKSTFFQRMFYDTHVRVNLDMLRTRRREDMLIEACLEMKQRLVIDNTNPTPAERAKYIEAAKRARFAATAYYFKAPLEVLLARNALRTGKKRVPNVGVISTYAKLVRPSRAEGFDRVHEVSLGADGEFLVNELNEVGDEV